jgi:hypothetical protein
VFVTSAVSFADAFSFSTFVEQAANNKKEADKIDIVFI